MTPTLRILLILCALAYTAYTIRKMRASTVEIGDMLFWIVFSAFLILISIFPEIMSWLSEKIGIQAPVNAVFLLVIGLLSISVFRLQSSFRHSI